MVVASTNRDSLVSPRSDQLLAVYRQVITEHASRVGLTFTTAVSDPLYGNVPVTALEHEIILSDGFRLLGDKSQMSVARAFPYRAMSHPRDEHSIGVMHLAGVAAARLGLNAFETELARVCGLLHDIGHLPFSHALGPLVEERTGYDHDHFVGSSIQELGVNNVIDQHRQRTGIQATQVAALLGHASAGLGSNRNRLVGWIAKQFADRLDYLARDLHYAPVTPRLRDLSLGVQSGLLMYLRASEESNFMPHFDGAALDLLGTFARFRPFLFGNFSLSPWADTANHVLERSLAAASKTDPNLPHNLLQMGDRELIDRMLNSDISPTLKRLLSGFIDDETTPVLSFHLGGLTPEEINRLSRVDLRSLSRAALDQLGHRVRGKDESPDDCFFGLTRPEEVKAIPVCVKDGEGELKTLHIGGGLPPSACMLYVISPDRDLGNAYVTRLREIMIGRLSIASGISASRVWQNEVGLSGQNLLVPERHVLDTAGARVVEGRPQVSDGGSFTGEARRIADQFRRRASGQ